MPYSSLLMSWTIRTTRDTNTEFEGEVPVSKALPQDLRKNASYDKRADLVPLFRLLMRQPPANHDCHSCAICKRYGITEI
jgi:hypothetical protein